MRNDIYDGVLKDCTLTGRVKHTCDRLSGAGAASLETHTTLITSTGAGQVVTLADGSEGQVKRFIQIVDGGSAVITPANFGGAASTTVTLVDAGDSVTFEFWGGNWWLVAQVANTEGTPLVIA